MADAEIDAKPVDQDALVADIDRTRAELARTIDAISDRVNPKKNVNRALEQVRQRASLEQLRQRGRAWNSSASGQARSTGPVIAGAAAVAVLVSVTVIFLVRRRKR